METKLQDLLCQNTVVIFGRKRCMQMLDLANKLLHWRGEKILIVPIDEEGEEARFREAFERSWGVDTFPVVFIEKELVGGRDVVLPMLERGTLDRLLTGDFDYELIIIGGGTCGVQAALASEVGLVALVDSDVDADKENSIGLGDGCKLVTELLPKHYLHKNLFAKRNAKRNEKVNTATIWQDVTVPVRKKTWQIVQSRMTEVAGSSHIRYYPGRGELIDSHTVRVTKSGGLAQVLTGRRILLATGTRPTLSDIEGASLGMTTQQLFQMEKAPGKVLIVGDALKCLEVGDILAKMGVFCIVMTSGTCSVFDQELMHQVITLSKVLGVVFHLDYRLTKLETEDGHIMASGVRSDGDRFEGLYTTVLFAHRRRGRTDHLGLEKVGLKVNDSNGKIVARANGTTVNPALLVTGSVLDGPFSCTDNVTCTQHTMNLIRGYKTGNIQILNTEMVPRIALTVKEYGAVGDTEESASAKYGEDAIVVYTATSLQRGDLFVKLICLRGMQDRILGIHILSPRAADMMQSFVAGMVLGLGKKDVEDTLEFTERKKRSRAN